jgi:hypothetical protein
MSEQVVECWWPREHRQQVYDTQGPVDPITTSNINATYFLAFSTKGVDVVGTPKSRQNSATVSDIPVKPTTPSSHLLAPWERPPYSQAGIAYWGEVDETMRRSRIMVISVYLLDDINRMVWECNAHGCGRNQY